MISKFIFNLVLVLSLSSLQIAFIRGLPSIFSAFNLVLVSLIFALDLGGLVLALWWSIAFGFLMDLYSFYPFGVYTVSLVLSVFISHYLLTSFFTNRSLYSFLAIIFFVTNFLNFFVFSLSGLIGKITKISNISLDKIFFEYVMSQVFLNLIGAIAIFYGLSFISNSLKPFFLVRK